MGPREFHEELPSTQLRAMELARAGAPPGTRVIARRQTAGRGRMDHRWASPYGGLYLSMLLPVPGSPPTLLPLGVGAHLGGEFARRWNVEARLKWPNDLLVAAPGARPRKLSGVLLDEVASPAGQRMAVAGIGVNVTSRREEFASVSDMPPAFLDELVRPCPSLGEVEEAAVTAASAAAAELGGLHGADATLRRCRGLLYGVGRRATVDGSPAGTIVGIADDGALLLDREGERMAIRAGDLRVEEP